MHRAPERPAMRARWRVMRGTTGTAGRCPVVGPLSRGATTAARTTSHPRRLGDTGASMTGPTDAPPRVRLRDVTLADADLIDSWEAERSEFNDFGTPRDPLDRDALARGPLRNERNGMLVIELVAEGRPIGTVGWHRAIVWPEPRVGRAQLRHRDPAGRARPRVRHRGPGPARPLPVRHDRRQPRRGVDRQRQRRRATLAREGRPAPRGRRPGCPVPRRRLSRPRHLRPRPRRPHRLTDKLARPAATVRPCSSPPTGPSSSVPRTSSAISPATTSRRSSSVASRACGTSRSAATTRRSP